MVLMVWLVECKKSKVSEDEQDIENMRLIAVHTLVTRAQHHGKLQLIDLVTSEKHDDIPEDEKEEILE
jgi:hypothetical protein